MKKVKKIQQQNLKKGDRIGKKKDRKDATISGYYFLNKRRLKRR